jgi:hypothetical protein
MKTPKTRHQWQIAVDAAEFLLQLDSARKYGLITGGPEANVERCVWILEEGARMGVKPTAGCIEEGLLAVTLTTADRIENPEGKVKPKQ